MIKYIICKYSEHVRLDIVHELWAEDWEDAMVKAIDFALHYEKVFEWSCRTLKGIVIIQALHRHRMYYLLCLQYRIHTDYQTLFHNEGQNR